MTGREIVARFDSAYTVTVGNQKYLIYRDGLYTHAVCAADVASADEAEFRDYSDWCDRVCAVADVDTAHAIMIEAGISILHLGDGCCTAVRPAPECEAG